MSLFWKRLFTVKNGESVIGSFALRLRNAATKLLYRCDCCPCEPAWYIAVLCPCNICGAPQQCSIGQVAESSTGITLYNDDGTPVTQLVIGDQRRGDKCILTAIGCYVQAVKHECRPPPFSGTVSTKIYIDGEEITQAAWSGSCTEGVPFELGWREFRDPGVFGRVLYVGHKFEESGVKNLDLVVEFSANGENAVRYTCRQSFKVAGPTLVGDYVPGQVIVAPGGMAGNINTGDISFCRYVGKLNNRYFSMFPLSLRGPFASKDHAEAVYDKHKTIIDIKAARCSCDADCMGDDGGITTCAGEHPFEYDFDPQQYPDILDSSYLDAAFGCNNQSSCGLVHGCDTGWMSFYFSQDGLNWEFVARLIDPEGNYVGFVSTGFLIPPCWRVDVGIRLNGTVSQGSWATFHAISAYIGSPPLPCPFCPNTDFDGSPPAHCTYHLETDTEIPPRWLSDWEYTPDKDGGPHGVPNNTAEHLDDIGEVLMAASVYKQMLDDLPEGLA